MGLETHMPSGESPVEQLGTRQQGGVGLVENPAEQTLAKAFTLLPSTVQAKANAAASASDSLITRPPEPVSPPPVILWPQAS